MSVPMSLWHHAERGIEEERFLAGLLSLNLTVSFKDMEQKDHPLDFLRKLGYPRGSELIVPNSRTVKAFKAYHV